MKQEQYQNQVQEQYKLNTLNRWLTDLSELDDFETIPINFDLAKFCTGELLSNIDNCITQTLSPIRQVNGREERPSKSFKNRFIIRILEWQSLREKDYDLIDELCSIVILNCLGHNIDVPHRIQQWDGKIMPKQLEELASNIGKSQVEIEKMIVKFKKGEKIEFKELEKSKNGSIEKGLERYKIKNKLLYNELKEKLNFTDR
jgi:hypothetical protein